MLTMEITRLIERCRQGDAEALGELYKAYARQMRGVCRRYICDEQTVEDVLHDAFVIIFTSFDRLRDYRRAEAWMTSITRNVASKCKDYLEALPTVSLDTTNEADLVTSVDEEKDVRGVPLSDVMRMIDRLPYGYGQVFRLSVFEGMSHKEIAKTLGIEPHSSSSQLARAKKMLRKMMQQYWVAVLLFLLMPIAFFLLWKEKPQIQQKEKTIVEKQKLKEDVHQASPKESPNKKKQDPMIVHVLERHRAITSVDTISIIAQTNNKKFLGTTDSVDTMQTFIARTNNNIVITNYHDTLQSCIAQTMDSVEFDILSNTISQEQMKPDSTTTDTTNSIRNLELPHYNMAELFPHNPVTNSKKDKRWSLELTYAGQFAAQNSYNQPFSYKPYIDPRIQHSPGEAPSYIVPSSIDNWTDYAVYLANNPDVMSEKTRSAIMRIALNNAGLPGEDKILRTSRHQMPITWSLALKYKLNNRFGLESGLSYSCLTSDFEMGADDHLGMGSDAHLGKNAISEHQTIHYLGIPMKGIYVMYGGKLWNLYGSIGLTTEIPVHSTLRSNYYIYGQHEASDKTTIRAPWQFSTNFGIGLQIHLTPNIGLFTEPSLQYFIPMQSDIETYRTEHPFTFSLPLGIKFTW